MTVATLVIQQWTGAGPTKTTVTTPRKSTSDAAAPGTNNPIPIPDSGFNYSYWMSLALTITNIQDATLLNNHKFYCDGAIGWALGTGGDLFVGVRDAGDNGCPDASYDQATGTPGTTGDEMGDAGSGHTYYKGQTPVWQEVDDYSSGAPLTVDTQDLSAAGSFDHVVLQAKVADDATRGAQSAETLTFQYDEV